jgi:glycosyltransferase involved in cell wall biosynthesis
MRIIQTTTSLAPEYGGPARSVPALSVELAKLGNRVTVLSLNLNGFSQAKDLPVHSELDYVSLPVSLQVKMRPLLIPSYERTMLSLVRDEKDLLIHDNGIWLPYSGIIHRIASRYNLPVITSTRGMLEPWAMKFGKYRKLAAWILFQRRRLARSAVLHATSREEAKHLRDLGLSNPVAVLPNGTAVPDLSTVPDLEPKEEKTLLFLSRIHPKKGLLNLVRAIEILQPFGWRVIIAGYDEGGYWDLIKKRIQQSNLERFFDYIGPISDQEKWSWYKQADLFILPSFSENFGLVVAEALASKTPVITTRGTPWKDLIDYNCGWWIEPEIPDLVDCLQQAFMVESRVLKQMGENGRRLVEEKYSWSVIAARLDAVYDWVLKDFPRPPEIIM